MGSANQLLIIRAHFATLKSTFQCLNVAPIHSVSYKFLFLHFTPVDSLIQQSNKQVLNPKAS